VVGDYLSKVTIVTASQFASKVMQEVGSKLRVKSTMSTAFHLQTVGETKGVNHELEKYLQVFGNFQQDNWVELIPFMEFAHNACQHSATGKSPFETKVVGVTGSSPGVGQMSECRT
jgi:hypothetical protein